MGLIHKSKPFKFSRVVAWLKSKVSLSVMNNSNNGANKCHALKNVCNMEKKYPAMFKLQVRTEDPITYSYKSAIAI